MLRLLSDHYPLRPSNTRFSCEDGAQHLPGAGFVSS